MDSETVAIEKVNTDYFGLSKCGRYWNSKELSFGVFMKLDELTIKADIENVTTMDVEQMESKIRGLLS